MLKLRRGVVVAVDPLETEIAGERRRAWADEGLVGPCEVGDEVVVNTAALDLELGSGGFDIVHVNLSRGLDGGEVADGVHVIKLNYASMQHAVEPVEAPVGAPPRPARAMPVLVLPLHGHLAPAAWAAAEARPGMRIGFLQTPGAALPGSYSRDVAALCERGLLLETITAGPCYGGDHESISVTGGLHAAAEALGWDAAIAGPGPGILGSASKYGHGGMAGLDTAHAALALGLPTLISPRLSAADPRPRHRGVSHHTSSVLDLLLAEVRVAVPADADGVWPEAGAGEPAGAAALVAACGERHLPTIEPADLAGYGGSGLPRSSMGRDLDQDPLFFAAPLAAGRALSRLSPGH